MIRTYPMLICKRPRRFYKFQPILSQRSAYECEEYCDDCMAEYQAQVDRERPDHVWAVDQGKVVYLEAFVAEHKLGRKLKPNETVVHVNGNVKDNRADNLDVVEIPDLGGK